MTSSAKEIQSQARALKEEAEVLENRICSECDGEGEVLATERITPNTIEPPYKKCPECRGAGII